MGYSVYFSSDSTMDVVPPIPAAAVAGLNATFETTRYSETRHGKIWNELRFSEDGAKVIFPDEARSDTPYWVRWLVEHFVKPYGSTLVGEVEWEGDERDDYGRIVAKDGEIRVYDGNVSIEWVERKED